MDGEAVSQRAAGQFEFTVDWFAPNIPTWDAVLASLQPRRVLEIGSYEGRSSCYLIERLGATAGGELICVDAWEGRTQRGVDLADAERRYDANIPLAQQLAAHPVNVRKIRARSDAGLLQLLASDGPGAMDLVYVDGCHFAAEVLCDAVLAFKLLRVGGVMIFDDYLLDARETGSDDLLILPKIAIDAFTSCYQKKLRLIRGVPIYQLYVEKIAD